MKKKALVLASCVAFATPTISIAQALPDNLIGLNLGDINASSYLDQPFKGVIPFLFTSVEDAKQLSVRLAPQPVFDKIGAEKLPVLNDLSFQIVTRSNKPVILISSSKPIQLPFLNFVLEIEGPNGVLYQDYTVLLDPQGYKPEVQVVQQQPVLFEIPDAFSNTQPNQVNDNVEKNTDLPITYSSTSVVTNQPQNYKTKAGDSLSRIAKQLKPNDIALKKMMQIIFDNNPKSFIRGDMDKIKRGVVLNLPTHKQLLGIDNIAKKVEFKGTTPKVVETVAAKDQYKVVKGDSLSKITKKYVSKDVSFTKMMNAIFTENPEAFSSKNKSKLKAGVTLRIPTIEVNKIPVDAIASTKPVSEASTITKTKEIDTGSVSNKAEVRSSEITTNDVKTAVALPLDNLALSTSNKATKTKTTTETLGPNEYRVKTGDTLTKITKEIGYPNVSFTRMMKAIYSENTHAFEKNNITKLKVGSVVVLPNINEVSDSVSSPIKQDVIPENLPETTETTTSNTDHLIDTSINESTVTPVVADIEVKSQQNAKLNISPKLALDTSELEKRIRELRTELEQARTGLAEMKSELDTKDAVIFDKDNQLVDLKSSLIKLKINQDADEELESGEIIPISLVEEQKLYSKYSTATPSQLAALKILKQSSEEKPKNGFNHMLSSAVKEYYDNTSPKSLAYLSMALILGWLLIRYRREIYSYTAISFDHPKYYPAPGIDEYELKERNISFKDPDKQKDPDKSYFEQTLLDTDSEPYQQPSDEFNTESTDSNHVEESEEIEHCEHLVTELFSDLNSSASSKTEVSVGDNEWLGIEKICDDYIESHSDHPQEKVTTLSEEVETYEKHINEKIDVIDVKDVNPESDATDFDEMMSDLLKSLDGVEKSINHNSTLKRNKSQTKPDSPEKIS